MTRAMFLPPCCRRLLVLLALLLPASAAAAAAAAPESARFADTCAAAVAAAERAHAIPDKLLAAISHAESGRWDATEQATIAWPWTVMAEGTGHYLPSRAAAVAKVADLQRRGVRNIDVGCMQVNLYYHPDAFADLAAAFDPATNAGYAGRFLADLQRETGSWGAAAARYHSATRDHAVPYRARVMRLWQAAKAVAARAPAGDAPTPVAAAGHDADASPDAASHDAASHDAASHDAAAVERRAAAAAHRRAIIDAYRARRAAAGTPQRLADAR